MPSEVWHGGGIRCSECLLVLLCVRVFEGQSWRAVQRSFVRLCFRSSRSRPTIWHTRSRTSRLVDSVTSRERSHEVNTRHPHADRNYTHSTTHFHFRQNLSPYNFCSILNRFHKNCSRPHSIASCVAVNRDNA